MSNSVATQRRRVAMRVRGEAHEFSLYERDGGRKYVNLLERAALLARIAGLATERRLFILTLSWTGARVSEVIGLCPASFQIDGSVVAVRTLKRRKHCIPEIPIPPGLTAELDACFRLRERQADPDASTLPLWRFHRVTAWRFIKAAMGDAGIHGVRASPRGLRHAFGVTTLAAGLPLSFVQRMLGHASIKTTTIYTEAIGPEQKAMAARFWRYIG
jgi:integrase/recombinase XerD